MKIKYLNYFLFFIFLSISMTGCDFFGDEEHCKNEVSEEANWLPDLDNSLYRVHLVEPDEDEDEAYYAHRIYFASEDLDDPTEGIFPVYNSCPFGAIVINIKITEKAMGVEEAHEYIGEIYEVQTIKGEKVKVLIKAFLFTKISEKEYISFDTKTGSNVVHELAGIIDEGPRSFLIACYAKVFPVSSGYESKYETWAKENIQKLEYKVNYKKWD